MFLKGATLTTILLLTMAVMLDDSSLDQLSLIHVTSHVLKLYIL